MSGAASIPKLLGKRDKLRKKLKRFRANEPAETKKARRQTLLSGTSDQPSFLAPGLGPGFGTSLGGR